jgi:hypothetical protein
MLTLDNTAVTGNKSSHAGPDAAAALVATLGGVAGHAGPAT